MPKKDPATAPPAKPTGPSKEETHAALGGPPMPAPTRAKVRDKGAPPAASGPSLTRPVGPPSPAKTGGEAPAEDSRFGGGGRASAALGAVNSARSAVRAMVDAIESHAARVRSHLDSLDATEGAREAAALEGFDAEKAADLTAALIALTGKAYPAK